jgi:5'-nucleotidase (lipoprotein e(P4) family)
MKKLLLLISMILCYSSISVANNKTSANGLPETTTPIAIHKDLLWFQHSAERIAIDREIFLSVEYRIQQKINSLKLHPKEWGVIIDIDETLLDNSAWNNKHSIKHSTQTWDQFAALSKSTAIPGAVEFTNHIHKMGGYVNLVSNRSSDLLNETKKNLKSQHIYFDQVLLDTSKQSTSFVDKNARFNAILNGTSPSQLHKQKIVAWLGDNIQDFPELKQRDLAKAPNSPAYHLFGNTYFVFPNPLYGSWE